MSFRERDGVCVCPEFRSVRYIMGFDYDRPHAGHPGARNHETPFCGLLVKQYPVYSLDRCHAVYHGTSVYRPRRVEGPPRVGAAAPLGSD